MTATQAGCRGPRGQKRGLGVALLAPVAVSALAVLLGSACVSAAPARASQWPDPRRDDRGVSQRSPRDDRDYRGTRDRRAAPRFDLAFRNGQEDGYKEGLHDAEKGDRFDPVREKRYRSGDHGYNKRYGSKELYRDRYRDGYRRGYEEGYQDGRRFDRRNSSRPGWWPFGR